MQRKLSTFLLKAQAPNPDVDTPIAKRISNTWVELGTDQDPTRDYGMPYAYNNTKYEVG